MMIGPHVSDQEVSTTLMTVITFTVIYTRTLTTILFCKKEKKKGKG